ncbi:recombinase family protein [Ciceribacter sp. RN22]|uniref:recombinase family protein n=1 Tax=Ciceribacter sp. RN22 TaxID=2954932 RepID=UPI0020925900|nr:recombinase family protein [Ciceribacter sp. RN22]MCO6181098.1 recombinase family protein [Ciceribacter sp. RN22]
MIVGYARVSTEEQKLDLQLQALEKAGCNRIYHDHGQSGCHFDRTGLDTALQSLAPGGTLVVWRLDRLGRSLSGLVQLIDHLGRREVNFQSVMENIDTRSPGGRLMFHLMASLAEFERAIISERTKAGLSAAKSRGAHLGRPRALTDQQVRDALWAIRHREASLTEEAKRLNVSQRTLQRYICGMRHWNREKTANN